MPMLRPPMSSQTAPATDPQAAAVLADYAGLRERIDAFFAGVIARHPGALQCQAGCAGCCQDGLSVSPIEAAVIRDYLARLPATQRRRIVTRARSDSEASADREIDSELDPERGRCAFLDAQERCVIYPVRPLVCRSQGLPLAYPADLVPAAALRFAARDGRAVVCCPLNFAADAAPATVDPPTPGAADILDAERIDVLLALLNRRFVAATSETISQAANPPTVPATDVAADRATSRATGELTRTSLRSLARGDV